MKKFYVKPEVEEVLLNVKAQILAGSGDNMSVTGDPIDEDDM